MKLETLTKKLNNARLKLLAAKCQRNLREEEECALEALDFYMSVATSPSNSGPLLKIVERFNDINKTMKKLERSLRKSA